MLGWQLFVTLAVVCFAIGLAIRLAGTDDQGVSMNLQGGTLKDANSLGGTMSGNPLPENWNEARITTDLRQLRDDRPSLIPHYVSSVLERFVTKQDDRTAQVRIQFVRSQFEQLKLAKDFQQTMNDLEILSYEKAKRIKTLQLETEELDSKLESRGELDRLASLKKRKEMELEIAKLDQQIADVKNPPKTVPMKTAQQDRAEKRVFWEAEIARLIQAQRMAMEAIPEDEQDSRIRTGNMYENATENARQQLSKYL